MVATVNRLLIHAAITKLLSGEDEAWVESAQLLVDFSMSLKDAGWSVSLRNLKNALPEVSSPAAAFGVYVVEHQRPQNCVEIASYAGVMQKDTLVVHRIFYDHDTHDPLVFVRVLQKEDWPDDVPLVHRIHRFKERLLNMMFQMPPDDRWKSKLWVAKQVTVVYSDVPEYSPGDDLPI